MSEAIGLIGNTMRADADALRVIGQNIANAEVTAYRRQISVSRPGFEQTVEAMASSPAIGAPVADTVTDSRTGTLRSTAEPLNVAIEGAGFFVLQGASGLLLTRRGDFHVSPDGILTAASGEAVLGTQGPIQLSTASPQIGADGVIHDGADVLGQLRLLQVADEERMQSLGNGVFVAPGDARAIDAGASVVRQGFLETSNVNPTGEMVQLMETLRHFEMAQRFVRGHDQMLEKAISELGKVG
jgi:flagellar basal-body rod protein FlgG